MTKANARLRITFSFDIKLPESVLKGSNDAFNDMIQAQLGKIVFQGMPVVTGKQLAQIGGQLLHCDYSFEATNLTLSALPRETVMAAAPHLTDHEVDQLVNQLLGTSTDGQHEELLRFIRRRALAMVNEYRTVPCVVEAVLTSGEPASLAGKLNLTNGSVLLGEANRQTRLRTGQSGIRVTAADGQVSVPASCVGHTLSGSVIEVQIADIAPYRDLLIALWESSKQ